MSNPLDVYRRTLLEHSRTPRHYNSLEQAACSAEQTNPLCGDWIGIEIGPILDGHFTEVGFRGEGCAVAIASASLLCQTLSGMEMEPGQQLVRRLIATLEGREAPNWLDAWGDLSALRGVCETGSRVSCALLAWQALLLALEEGEGIQ